MKSRNPIPEGFNTGALIHAAMRKTGKKQVYIARKTGRNPNTVKNLRRRRSIQASILHEFCLVLEVDLFRPLSDNLPEHIRANPEKEHFDLLISEKQTLSDKVEELEVQLKREREDNAYLKKMIDIMASK